MAKSTKNSKQGTEHRGLLQAGSCRQGGLGKCVLRVRASGDPSPNSLDRQRGSVDHVSNDSQQVIHGSSDGVEYHFKSLTSGQSEIQYHVPVAVSSDR